MILPLVKKIYVFFSCSFIPRLILKLQKLLHAANLLQNFKFLFKNDIKFRVK